MTIDMSGKSLLAYSKLAGFSLLLMFILAIFANFFVLEGLITPGDATSTAHNIIENELLFRAGILSFLIVLILDVLVAWALYIFLAPIHQNLAMLAAWFRLIYTAIFGVAISHFLSVLQLLSGSDYLTVFEKDQLNAHVLLSINSFNNVWLIGLVFFSIHLFIVGYLIVKSGFMPKIIGILLMVASMGYLIDNFAKVLLSNYTDYESIFLIIVAVPAVIGELSLAIWLLFKRKNTHEMKSWKVK